MSNDTPLDVMLDIMMKNRASGDNKLALDAAKAAAPYVHGKAAVVRRGIDLSRIPDDELEKYCRGEKYLPCGGGEELEVGDPGDDE